MKARAPTASPAQRPRSARSGRSGRSGRFGRRRRAALAALAALAVVGALGGCFGDTGTLSVGVTAAPGSPLLDQIQRVRLTLSSPRTVVEAVRRDGSFALALEAEANDEPADLALEGFDASGQLVAVGRTPQFSVGAIDARVVIYLAPLRYGAIVVGGRDNADGVRGEVELYNAYDHTLARGLDLPQGRAAPAVAALLDGRVFVVGGLGSDGAAQASGWQFDTNLSPAGAFRDLEVSAAPRAGERALQLAPATFLLTGAPARIDVGEGTAATTVTAGEGAPLPSAAAAVRLGAQAVVIAAGERVLRYRDGVVDELDVAQARRRGHAVVATSDDQIAVLGGELSGELTADAVKIDPSSGAATVVRAALETPRRAAAVARTGDTLIVAGGIAASGIILDTAELLDAETLAHLATIAMPPRAAAAAEVLPNGQILFIGGLDDRARATAQLLLYTPELP